MKIPTRVPEDGFYYHYKHDPNGPVNNYAYEIIGIGFDTEEDGRWDLIYRPLYEANVYKAAQQLGIPCFDKRLLSMWMENVTKDGNTIPRFSKITDPNAITQLQEIKARMYG